MEDARRRATTGCIPWSRHTWASDPTAVIAKAWDRRGDYGFPAGTYADGEWHQALGTFNRFAPDGNRVKLYVDGQKVFEIPGSDLPMLRGEDRLVLGKYSSNEFFIGDIDEVLVRSYAMTEDEIAELYGQYVPESDVEEVENGAARADLVTIRRNPGGSHITISFTVPRPAATTLTIFVPTGRVVARPYDEDVDASEYEVVWDGRDRDGVHQPFGVYYYRFECGGLTDGGSLQLIR